MRTILGVEVTHGPGQVVGLGADRGARRGTGSVEAGETDGVGPRQPDLARPVELRSGRAAFTVVGVASVQTPEAGEVVEGRPLGRHQLDVPAGDLLAVPGGRVDEGHTEGRTETALGRLIADAEGRSGPPLESQQPPEPRHVDPADVVARAEVEGVGAGAGVEDRSVVETLALGVVPVAAEVGPDVVVVGGHDPDRPAVGRVTEDPGLLPVGFVIVQPPVAAPPVVHGVEPRVVQHQPAADVGHPAVDDRLIVEGEALDLEGRSCGGQARGGRSHEHAEQEERVEDPTEEADPAEAGSEEPAGHPPGFLRTTARRSPSETNWR